MKKNIATFILSVTLIIFLLPGCAEHRYYHKNHYHTVEYYHRHHRTPPPGIHIDIRN